jgi:hypothetical protein
MNEVTEEYLTTISKEDLIEIVLEQAETINLASRRLAAMQAESDEAFRWINDRLSGLETGINQVIIAIREGDLPGAVMVAESLLPMEEAT